MIVEQRTYTTHPGRVPDYLRLYETHGLAPQRQESMILKPSPAVPLTWMSAAPTAAPA